jgi:hypothetical protein
MTDAPLSSEFEVGAFSLLSDIERRGSLDGVPVLAGKRILGLLLEALLALRQSLVPERQEVLAH